MSHVTAALTQASDALARLIADTATLDRIDAAGTLLADAFCAGGRAFSCGNGGSFCDAAHFAEELSGKFRAPRRPLPALAISDAAHLTCVGNDYGYEEVFARFVEAHGRRGDVLVGISTSGGSRNIVLAAERAKAAGMSVIALTGRQPSAL